MKKILIIDDDEDLTLQIVPAVLNNYEVISATTGAEGLQKYIDNNYDFSIVIADYHLPDLKGSELVTQILNKNPKQIIVILTGDESNETFNDCYKVGIIDHIDKQFMSRSLRIKIDNLVKKFESTNNLAPFEKPEVYSDVLAKKFYMIGNSPALVSVLNKAEKFAKSDTTVLITGENGTGKELLAKGIRDLSTRKNGPFITVNCAAIPKDLFESELFGHKAGSFTGAKENKIGKIKAANQGTLFLDEIGEIPLDLQAKLLRFLESKTVVSIGENEEKKVDVRIITATNRNLEKEVKNSNFREDLYHRISILPIHLPSLRDRKTDIKLLLNHFATTECDSLHPIRFTREAQEILSNYTWSGNIRELRNEIIRLRAVLNTSVVESIHLDEKFFRDINDLNPSEKTLKDSVDTYEKKIIINALNISTSMNEAAERLNIPKPSLQTKMKKYQLITYWQNLKNSFVSTKTNVG